MQAIILAAGMGRRLGELTGGNTKCMLEVNGLKLIDRVLRNLSLIPISRIVLVVGYKADNVKKYVGNNYNGIDVIYVENQVYDKTNNIYSLFLAKNYLMEQDTILLESDLIFDESVLPMLVDDPTPNLALVDKYESWMDGTVVTIDPDNYVKRFVAKKYFKFDDVDKYYKTVNIYKFSREFSSSHYVPFLEAYCSALGNNEYYEQVLRVITLTDNTLIKALPLSGQKWYEIDDLQDLDIAESMFAATDDDQWKAYTFRYGGYWRYPKMLDFCYLVNPYFPNERMLSEMKANFDVLIREYPSGMGVNSLLAAKYFAVKKDYIVVGNGAAELIKSFIENYVGTMGVTFPTFEEYPNRLPPNRVVRYIPDNDNFGYSVADLIAHFNDKSIDTLLVINPDNPSGNYLNYNELLTLIEWSAKKGIKLIVDESFVDFAKVEGTFSLLNNEVLCANKHLTVIKSISKSYGVPGIRLGVLATGDTEIIARLKKDVAIWNINSFGEFYMQIFGKYESDYRRACQMFIAERERFHGKLSQVSFLRVIPSEANYFMCEVIGGRFTSRELAIRLLRDYEILIKDCSGKDAFSGKQYVRLAVRNTADNDKLVNALNSMNELISKLTSGEDVKCGIQ